MKLIRALMILTVLALAFAVFVFFLRFTCAAVVLTISGVLYASKTWRPEPTSHGSASFADEDEIRKAGLL